MKRGDWSREFIKKLLFIMSNIIRINRLNIELNCIIIEEWNYLFRNLEKFLYCKIYELCEESNYYLILYDFSWFCV